jgi:hypothetical protein
VYSTCWLFMTGLGPVLARLGLAQYTAAFLEEGFETWETVLDITESDLYVAVILCQFYDYTS